MIKTKLLTSIFGFRYKIIVQLTFLCYLLLSSFYIKAELHCQTSGSGSGGPATSVSKALEGMCDWASTGNGCVGYLSDLNLSEQMTFAASGTCYRNCGYGPSYAGTFIVSCSAEGPTYFIDINDLDEEKSIYGVQDNSSCNPINLVTGNKYKIHTDISPEIEGSTLQKPAFTRIYNSSVMVNENKPAEKSWTHNYQRKMEFIQHYLPAVNYVGRTDAPSNVSANKQSNIYYSKQQACELGFSEIVSKDTSLSSRFLSGTPVYIYGRCILRDINGWYITEIPIKSSVTVSANSGPTRSFKVKLHRPDGNVYLFSLDGTSTPSQQLYTTRSSGINVKLIKNIDTSIYAFEDNTLNYIYVDSTDTKEMYSKEGVLQSITYPNGIVETLIYDASGLLEAVSNNFGHSIQFTYNALNLIETITEKSKVWKYFYNSENLIEKVINPDLTEKNYHYVSNNQGTLLAGLTDERNIRYSTFDYHDDGLAKSSYLGNGTDKIEKISVIYGANGDAINEVTNSKGLLTKYTISNSAIKSLVTKIDSGVCPTCTSADVSYGYSSNTVNPFQSKLDVNVKTEFDITTQYDNYDGNHNPTIITQAVGTSEEKLTTYAYDARFGDAVTEIVEPSVFEGNQKVTSYVYDDYKNLTSVTVAGFQPDGSPVTRSSSYKNDGPFHQLSEINGPRIDVNDITYFDYYPNDALQNNNRARLSAVRTYAGDYLKQNIQYTATGKVESENRTNNLYISYLYYPGNDRIKDIIQTDTVSGAVRTVRYTYLATGEVESITQGADSANAVTLTLSYDNARRLTRITDGLNNYIEYILDTEGNVEKENIHDASGVLKKSLVQTFDNYNRLESFTQMNEGKVIDFNPDGTINTETDGKGVLTDYSYDALKRLTTVTQDKNGTNLATANAATQFVYDVQNNLTSVKDANDGETVYVYDDLGNLLSRTSPDTGTVTYQYDGAGNIIQSVDAKSKLFTYSYDVYNRLTSVIAPVAEDSSDYIYDDCPQGYGKLCSSQRHNSQLSYQYNAFGEVTSLGQYLVTWAGYNAADNNVKYNYDAVGNIKSITYPSGAIVNYTYNSAGKIDNVNLDQNGSIKTLSLSVNYLPFGEETVQTYGNGMNVVGLYDQAYRPFIVGDPSFYFEYIFGYDANGNIDGIITGGQGAYFDSAFSYDEHQRLTSSTGFHDEFTYNYDLVGNKLTQTQSETSTSASYSPNTNRLVSLAGVATNTDENGNISHLRGMSLIYTVDNRLKSTNTGVSFEYHAQGQRSIKHSIAPGDAGTLFYSQSTSFVYGLNGELLAEVGPTGSVKKEYIYLNNKPLVMLEHKPDSNELFLKADLDNDGEISVEDSLVWYFNYRTDNAYEVTGDGIAGSDDINAVINCGLTHENCVAARFSTDIYYIHNDHLGTPKMLTNSSREVVWRSITTPFGKAAINADADGDGVAVEFNIRQPGQYYDVESGLYYNYYRYYDPETGRYISSDPIGLAGGINTYAYVGGNPLKFVDPFGLNPIVRPGATGNPVSPGWTPPDSVSERVGDAVIRQLLKQLASANGIPPMMIARSPTLIATALLAAKPTAMGDGTLPSSLAPMPNMPFLPKLPGLMSPDPTDPNLQREFCRQNPSACDSCSK